MRVQFRKESGIFKKENSGEFSKETFFHPVPVIQRKCEKCEEEKKQVQRSEDKKEEENVQRKIEFHIKKQ